MQGPGLCQSGPGLAGVSPNPNRPRWLSRPLSVSLVNACVNRMSTFCQMMPLGHNLPHPQDTEGGAKQTIQTASSVGQTASSKYKQPELV